MYGVLFFLAGVQYMKKLKLMMRERRQLVYPEQGCTRFMYLNRLQGELTLLL